MIKSSPLPLTTHNKAAGWRKTQGPFLKDEFKPQRILKMETVEMNGRTDRDSEGEVRQEMNTLNPMCWYRDFGRNVLIQQPRACNPIFKIVRFRVRQIFELWLFRFAFVKYRLVLLNRFEAHATDKGYYTFITLIAPWNGMYEPECRVASGSRRENGKQARCLH